MSSSNNNSEHFSFDFRKLKFDANKPGKETRKTLAVIGVFVILLFLLVLLGMAFLHINPLTLGICGGSAALVTAIAKAKGGRSP